MEEPVKFKPKVKGKGYPVRENNTKGAYMESLQSLFATSFDSEIQSQSSFPFTLTDLMLSCTAKASRTAKSAPIDPKSHFNDPIDTAFGRLSGYSRDWAGASTSTQIHVMKKILDATGHYSIEDRAFLLGTAYVESGFNPDAAAKSTSASGLFQFIDATGAAYGLDDATRFEVDSNLEAGLKLFQENLKTFNRNYSTLTGDARYARLYALHHDGPSLAYGGEQIAKEKLIPTLPKFEALVEMYGGR